jgi:hypothetical protein
LLLCILYSGWSCFSCTARLDGEVLTGQAPSWMQPVFKTGCTASLHHMCVVGRVYSAGQDVLVYGFVFDFVCAMPFVSFWLKPAPCRHVPPWHSSCCRRFAAALVMVIGAAAICVLFGALARAVGVLPTPGPDISGCCCYVCSYVLACHAATACFTTILVVAAASFALRDGPPAFPRLGVGLDYELYMAVCRSWIRQSFFVAQEMQLSYPVFSNV